MGMDLTYEVYVHCTMAPGPDAGWIFFGVEFAIKWIFMRKCWAQLRTKTLMDVTDSCCWAKRNWLRFFDKRMRFMYISSLCTFKLYKLFLMKVLVEDNFLLMRDKQNGIWYTKRIMAVLEKIVLSKLWYVFLFLIV